VSASGLIEAALALTAVKIVIFKTVLVEVSVASDWRLLTPSLFGFSQLG